jgi:hypothetical protein
MKADSQQAANFRTQLDNIEEHTARLLANRALQDLSSARRMQEKSLELLVAIVSFFDVALCYFCQNLLRMLPQFYPL